MSSTGEDSWVAALREAEGKDVKDGADQLWGGLGGANGFADDPARVANRLLLDWLSENGVYISEKSSWMEAPHPLGLSTETFDENNDNEASGRGLIARRGINEGDKLFSIPLGLCLTKAACRRVLGPDAVPASTSEYIAIALLAMHEKFLVGESSFWWPYLNILPTTEEVNPSFAWAESELALLEGSPAIAATRSMQLKLRTEYEALKEGIFAKNKAAFPGVDWEELPQVPTGAVAVVKEEAAAAKTEEGGEGAAEEGAEAKEGEAEGKRAAEAAAVMSSNGHSGDGYEWSDGPFSFKNFQWAFTMLFSRAIRLERLSDGEAVALVPYADLINHSPFSAAYINAEPGEKSIFGDEPDKVVVFADRAFKKMEQVFISYGQKSNAELLLLYGFSLDRNPFNAVEVSVGLSRDDEDDPDGTLYEEKLALLKESGRSDAVGQGLTFPLYNDRFPNELLEALRLLVLKTSDVERVSDGRRVPITELRLQTPINDANEVSE